MYDLTGFLFIESMEMKINSTDVLSVPSIPMSS